MLFALLATFQCADTPPPVYSKPPFNGQTFYICLASTLVPGDLLVDPFSPDILSFISDKWGSLYYHSLAGGPHHPQRNHAIPDYGK